MCQNAWKSSGYGPVESPIQNVRFARLLLKYKSKQKNQHVEKISKQPKVQLHFFFPVFCAAVLVPSKRPLVFSQTCFYQLFFLKRE